MFEKVPNTLLENLAFFTYIHKQSVWKKVKISSKISTGADNFDYCFCVIFDRFYKRFGHLAVSLPNLEISQISPNFLIS